MSLNKSNLQEFFSRYFKLAEPVYIKQMVSDEDKQEYHIHMGVREGANFTCPVCGKGNLPLHDTVDKVWLKPKFSLFKCFLHMSVPRANCPDCGVQTMALPWANDASGFKETEQDSTNDTRLHV